jgi:hypothetical protein
VFALWFAAIVADPFLTISARGGAFADKVLSFFNTSPLRGWLTA